MMLRSLGLVTFLSCLHPFIKGSFKLIKVVAKKNSLPPEKKLNPPVSQSGRAVRPPARLREFVVY